MAALSEIEKLEARYAENPDGRYFAPLADAYRKAGRVDDALQMIQLGLSKHPDYLSAHIVLGRCLLDKKDDGAAQNAFQNVLGLDAENIIALKSLAEIAERQGRVVDARRWLQRLLTVDAMNDDAAADLQRLGGPPGEGEAAVTEAAPALAEPVAGFSMIDLLGPETPATPAPAPEPVAAAQASVAPPLPEPPSSEPPAPAPLSPRPSFTESPTAPIPAFGLMPTAEPPTPRPPAEPLPFTFEPTASPEVEKTPVAPLHEFQSMSFEAPLELPPMAPELERTTFEPAEVPPAPPVEGFTDFDDRLAWGAGERMSHAIRAEDVAAAESAASESAAPIEFIAPTGSEEALPSLDLSAMEIAEEKVELPARSTGAIEVDLGALEGEPPAEAAPAPAGAEAPHAAHDLPLIMPEDVTPAEELRRPSAKQVATVSPEPEREGGSAHEPLATETMGDLYMQQGLRGEAADVYRKILERHPGDAVVQGKLAAIESPPALGAVAMGVESVGAWLRRIAKATLGAPAPAPPAPPADEPTPMDQAFAASSEPEAPPPPAEEAAAADAETISGAPARQASEALSLEQIFGTPAPAAAPPPPPPSGPHAMGASFDEFFGAGAPAQESVRPKDSPAPRQSEDDLSAFTAWLHGLKR